MKLKIKGKINSIIIPLIILTCLIFGSVIIYNDIHLNMKNIKLQLNSGVQLYQYTATEGNPISYSIENGKLFINGEDAAKSQHMEILKKHTGCEYIIFIDGKPVVSTYDQSEKGDIEISGKKFDELLQTNKAYNGRAVIDGKQSYMDLQILRDKLGNRIGMLMISLDITKYITEQRAYLQRIIIFSVLILMTAVILSALVSKYIEKRIRKVEKHIAGISNKDFSKEVSQKVLKSYDEIGDIGRSISRMQRDISETMGNIQEMTGRVNDSAGQLSGSASRMKMSSDSIMQTVQNVTSATQTQADDLSELSEVGRQLGESVVKVSDAMKEIGKISSEVNGRTKESIEKIQEGLQNIDDFNRVFSEYTGKVAQFQRSISSVDEIINTISSVAKQTNLLALNAAIEAARAGEAGKGFNVVAKEIGKLAMESHEAATDIEKIINEIVTGSARVSEDTSLLDDKLQAHSEGLAAMVRSVETIVSSTQQITPQTGRVEEVMQQLNKQKICILEKIENASSMAQEISASCEEVSALQEEMNAGNSEVEEVAARLKTMTESLESEIGGFEIMNQV